MVSKFKITSDVVVSAVGIAMSVYHLYFQAVGWPHPLELRSVHLLFGLILAFLTRPISKRFTRLKIIDYALVAISFPTLVYVVLNKDEMIWRTFSPTLSELVMGMILIILVLEATRRTVGMSIPILAIMCMLYAYFGYLIPGYMGHKGFSVEKIVGYMFNSMEGIFGTVLGVSATYLMLFSIFAAFLEKTGLGEMMGKIFLRLLARIKNGPILATGVVGCLFASMTGSAVSNVLMTGSVTLDTMRRAGVKPERMAWILAIVGCGALLMPPVMGAGAFIMAEFLGLPYGYICFVALLPAILFFVYIIISEVLVIHPSLTVKGEASTSDRPYKYRSMIKDLYAFAPLAVLIYFIASGMDATMAAFYATFVALALSYVRKETALKPKDVLKALKRGAEMMINIVPLNACAGLIVGSFGLTGLGLKFTSIALGYFRGELIPVLLLAMAITILLGCAMPAVAAYVVAVILMAPTMSMLGLPLLVAHMFVFFFSVFAQITPPVAVASYAAATITNTNPIRVGFLASLRSIPLFTLPFAFVFDSSLLLQAAPLGIAFRTAMVLVGFMAFSAAVNGFLFVELKMVYRVCLALLGLLIILPHPVINVPCAIAFICATLVLRALSKRRRMTKERL